MMRHPRSLRHRRLRRANIQPAIHRHRIAAHNLAVELLSKRQRKRSLTTRRRSHDDDQRMSEPGVSGQLAGWGGFYHWRHHPGTNNRPNPALAKLAIRITTASRISPRSRLRCSSRTRARNVSRRALSRRRSRSVNAGGRGGSARRPALRISRYSGCLLT